MELSDIPGLDSLIPVDQIIDQAKVGLLKEAIDTLTKDFTDEQLKTEVGAKFIDETKLWSIRSRELLLHEISQKAYAQDKWKPLLFELCGGDKDHIAFKMLIAEPRTEDSEVMRRGFEKRGQVYKNNMYFPLCNLGSMPDILGMNKDQMQAKKDLKENFAFPLGQPLCIPRESNGSFLYKDFRKMIAKQGGTLLEQGYPKITAFEDLANGVYMNDGSPIQIVTFDHLNTLPVDDKGYPEQDYLDRLSTFVDGGGSVFLQSSVLLAYVEVYDNGTSPEQAFAKLKTQPTMQMLQTADLIHQKYHA